MKGLPIDYDSLRIKALREQSFSSNLLRVNSQTSAGCHLTSVLEVKCVSSTPDVLGM